MRPHRLPTSQREAPAGRLDLRRVPGGPVAEDRMVVSRMPRQAATGAGPTGRRPIGRTTALMTDLNAGATAAANTSQPSPRQAGMGAMNALVPVTQLPG